MKVFLWTNNDLDGVGAAILLGNIFQNFEYQSIFFGDFMQKFPDWYDENRNNYDKIFVVGIPLEQSLINKTDDKKLIFVSDKKEELTTVESKLISEDSTSCSKMLYKIFKSKFDFPDGVKKFIAYVNDYNSYELKTKEAKILNGLFRKSGSRKFYNFVNRFWSGIGEFTESEIRLAGSFYKELNAEMENLELFFGSYKDLKVVATFSNFSVNEIAATIIDHYDADVAIVVNTSSQYVSFRKKKGSAADIKFMAENLCSGGGSDQAAGGKLTQKFLEFTQTLSAQ
jgi:oligoribonuclease NrnB/cAMP/cGMP phosphodiesterase (DHH superfamily)